MRHAPLLLLLFLGAATAADDGQSARVDRMKAGYLHNFLKFVEWPPPAAAAEVITVCFRGAAGVRSGMEAGIANKRVAGKRLALRQLAQNEGMDGCHAVFFEAALAQIDPGAPSPAAAPILTVSDSKDFVRRGGMIELFIDQNKMRFSINVGNVRRARLKLASELLLMATVVGEDA